MQRVYVSIRDIRNKDWNGTHYPWTVPMDRISCNVRDGQSVEDLAIDLLDEAFYTAKDLNHIGQVRYYGEENVKPSVLDLAWAVYDKADFNDKTPTPVMQSINW